MIHEIAEVIVARDTELKELDYLEFASERKARLADIEERYKARMDEVLHKFLKHENA